MPKAIAVACSDVHLSETAPVARAGEPDWVAKQKEALLFVRSISEKLNVPMIIAGDLFHKAKAGPVMEITAIDALQELTPIMIPGQHDLPNHKYENKDKGSYGVLQTALNLDYGDKGTLNGPGNVSFHLFPFGSKLKSCKDGSGVNVAVVHTMVWRGTPPYPGAPEEGNVKELINRMKGYDFIICGDYHKPFTYTKNGTCIINCGSLTRRSADQEDHQPRCYVLYDDGTCEPHYLPIEKDVFTR